MSKRFNFCDPMIRVPLSSDEALQGSHASLVFHPSFLRTAEANHTCSPLVLHTVAHLEFPVNQQFLPSESPMDESVKGGAS
jgi:hypothetical protein